MSTTLVPSTAACSENSDILIGALAPLSKPGWVDAGKHLLAGLELAVEEVNNARGVCGRPIKLVVRDTAADAQKAVAAIDEFVSLGVTAVAGEYHSVVACAAAAKADAVGLPYLCSSAVLDELTEQPTDWVARLAPAQSRGWRVYADFLLSAGHGNIAIAGDFSSEYWVSGTKILKERLREFGGSVTAFDIGKHPLDAVAEEIVRHAEDTTALLVLTGIPDPAASIVKAVRRDKRLAGMMIGCPAGQSELGEWLQLLGPADGTAIPFLRYMPEQLNPLGAHVQAILRETLDGAPSFVAFEGYDTIIALSEMIRYRGLRDDGTASSWSQVVVDGTRGQISFARAAGVRVWQWVWPPIQVVDRDPAGPSRLRTLYIA